MNKTFLCLSMAVFTVVVDGQTEKPNFSGLWIMVSPQQGYSQLVTQDDATLRSRPPTGQRGEIFVIKLDGTESRNVVKTEAGDAVGSSTASWEANQLAIASTVTWSTGQKLEQAQVWFLDDQGRLVIEFQIAGAEPRRMIYRRQRE